MAFGPKVFEPSSIQCVILCTCDEGSPVWNLVRQAPMEYDGVAREVRQSPEPTGATYRWMENEMNNGSTNRGQPRSIGQSILALFAGFVAGVVLSVGTDLGLHAVGLWPSLGQPMSGPLLLFATLYRTIYGIISAYIVARLAPFRPMEHALIGGAIGTVVSIIGAAVTWNRGLGPHWYPVALIFVALPSAWVGGRLRLAQLRRQTAA